MNKIPTRLKQEPLIEAIWQAQFEPKEGLSVGDLLPGILYAALKDDHPGLQLHRLPTADIPAPVAEMDPNLRFAAKYRMEEADSPFLFQVGDRIVTVNCRKPYAGWAAFKQKTERLIHIITDSKLVPVPVQHSLRSIDLMHLDPAPSLAALQVDFKMGRWQLEGLPIQMRAEIADGDYHHVVQIATPAEANLPEGRVQGSVVDLETFCSVLPTSWEDVRSSIDEMHQRSKEVFYQQLLTESAIERLEPEY